MQQMSSAQIVSASAMQNKTLPLHVGHTPVSYGGSFWQPGIQAAQTQEWVDFYEFDQLLLNNFKYFQR